MKCVQVVTLLTVISWAASEAWGQFGLYGSPQMVDLSALEGGDPGLLAPASPSGDTQPFPLSGRTQGVAGTALPPLPQAGADRADYGDANEVGRPAGGFFGQRMWPAAGRRRAGPTEAPGKIRPPSRNAPGVVDQILEEADSRLLSPSPDPGPSAPGDAAYDCWAEYGDTTEQAAESYCDPCVPCFESNWYVSASGLIMGRDDANRVWVSYESGVNANQLMHTQDIGLDWRGGGEIRFGRVFCCGAWALEAAYWTLDPFRGSASQTHASGVATPLDFTDVTYATIAGNPGDDLFDGAVEHRIWREDEIHNIEVNLIRNQMFCQCLSPLDIRWLVGVRFFRFDEDLTFGSLAGGVAFGDDPTLEGYLYDRVVNNLVGAQFGCDVTYRRGNWRLFAVPKVGIYNNHVRHRFEGYRGDGELFSVVPAGYPSYPVSSSDNGVSFLTEVDLGLEWQFAPRWAAHIGYRAVVLTGMALADHQIPPYIVDTPELADIDRNGSLILHGGFAGLTFNF